MTTRISRRRLFAAGVAAALPATVARVGIQRREERGIALGYFEPSGQSCGADHT